MVYLRVKMYQFNLIVLFSLITLTLSANVDILYSPKSLIFQNTTQSLSSSDLSKFIQQCLGYTTNKPNWNGFYGYKNIAKNIPKSVIVFHMPTSLQTIAAHTFPIEMDSQLKDQYDQTKEAMITRQKNILTEYVELYDKNSQDSTVIQTELDAIEKYLKNIEPRNEEQSVLLWFEMLASTKDQLDSFGTNIEERFKKILSQLKHLFGSNILVMSIQDENQIIFERTSRQTKAKDTTAKPKKINLAHEYASDFHSSFVAISFATILFVLAVFVISVSLWNIDPGRDSIIYRLTAQKMKKEQ